MENDAPGGGDEERGDREEEEGGIYNTWTSGQLTNEETGNVKTNRIEL